MNHPTKTRQPGRGQDLVRTYIEFVGGQEPDNRAAIEKLEPTDPRHASLLIGRSCLILIDGNDRAADRMLRRVQRDMQPLTQSPYTHNVGMASRLRHLATLLEERDNPAAAVNYQTASRTSAVEGIRQNHVLAYRAQGSTSTKGAQKAIRNYRRDASKLRIAALLGRRDPSSSLTTPAPLHWINSHGLRYDLLFINGGSDPEVYKAQIEHPCLGFCEDNTTEKNTLLGLHLRTSHTEDTAFISDHCDTNRANAGQRGERKTGLNNLLSMEQQGNLAPEHLSTLNFVTEGLVSIVTSSDPLRRGILPVEPVQPFQI